MRIFKTFNHLLDKGYWFSDNRVSAFASQLTGGLNQIDYHGQQPGSHNAKIFQSDQAVLTVFLLKTREGKVEERRIDFDEIQVYPFGFVNQCGLSDCDVTFSMTIFGKALTLRFRLNNTGKESFEGAVKARFNLLSQSTQVHGDRIWYSPKVRKDGSVLLRCHDRIILKDWFEKKGDYLISDLWHQKAFNTTLTDEGETVRELKPEYRKSETLLYDADIFAIIGGNSFKVGGNEEQCLDFHSRERNVKAGTSGETIPFVISFGDTEKEAARNHTYALENASKIENKQMRRYQTLEKSVPKLTLPGYKKVEELFRLTPQVVESAKIDEVGMTRACPSSYYEVWGWDNLVTGMELAKWGDQDFLQKMVEFFRTHRSPDGGTPGRWTRQWEPMDSRGIGATDFLYVSLILELYNTAQDKNYLKKCYHTVKLIFDSLSSRINEEGFYKTLGMYPDFPRRLGRNNNSFVAQDEAAWYCLAKFVEIIASLLGDESTSEKARHVGAKVRESFCKTFLDNQKGFFFDSINSETRRPVEAYTLYTLLFLHNSIGFDLLNGNEELIGKFVRDNFLQEHGLGMSPRWDKHHRSEIAMTSWYPHWDIYPIKLLRRLGDTDSLVRWLRLVQDCYRRLGYCPELVSLRPEDIHPQTRWMHHGSPWNLNCATGWYKSFVESIIGIESDIGGLTYIPCPLPFEVSLSKLRFRQSIWNIEIHGEGQNVEEFLVDGRELDGSYKIPRKFYRGGSHRLEVRYGIERVDRPIILELRGGEVSGLVSSKGHLKAEVRSFGSCTLLFVSATRPVVLLDEKKTSIGWDESRGKGSVQITVPGKHSLVIGC